MLKILVTLAIIGLSIATFWLGFNDHLVGASVCAYLDALLVVLTVHHYRCVSWRRLETQPNPVPVGSRDDRRF